MELSALISKVIAYLKEITRLSKGAASEALQLSSANLTEYIKNSIFAKNDKSTKIFIGFMKNVNDLSLKGKLELRLEDVLEDKPLMQEKLGTLVLAYENSKLHASKLHSQLSEITQKLQTLGKEHPEHKTSLDMVVNLLKDIKDENLIPKSTENKPEVTEQSKTKKQMESQDKSVASNGNLILVPWDFSEVAENALQHAVNYANTMGGKIGLVHVVKKVKEITVAKAKLKTIETRVQEQNNQVVVSYVREGNIFTTITEIAEEKNANLVIMGTHGIKGMQKLTGSWALKVIADTKSPFVVVQKKAQNTEIKRVVLPVDHRRESKQLINVAKMIAHYYDVTFLICKSEESGNQVFQKKTENNFNFIRSYCKQIGFNYEPITVLGTKNMADAILKYAREENPDLVMVLITKDIGLQDYMLGADEQKIIANDAKVPVMCINPVHSGKWSVSSGTVG